MVRKLPVARPLSGVEVAACEVWKQAKQLKRNNVILTVALL